MALFIYEAMCSISSPATGSWAFLRFQGFDFTFHSLD